MMLKIKIKDPLKLLTLILILTNFLWILSLLLGNLSLLGLIFFNALSVILLIRKSKGRIIFAFLISTLIYNFSLISYQLLASLFLISKASFLGSLAFLGYLLGFLFYLYFLFFLLFNQRLFFSHAYEKSKENKDS